jgi:hypothetical protein
MAGVQELATAVSTALGNGAADGRPSEVVLYETEWLRRAN